MHNHNPRPRNLTAGHIPKIRRVTDPIATAEQAHRDIALERSMAAHPAGKARRPQPEQRPMTRAEAAFLIAVGNGAVALAAVTAYAWITGGQAPL